MCVAIGRIKDDSQIEHTNLKVRDKILTINGKTYTSYDKGMEIIKQSLAKSNYEVTLGF